MQYSFNLLRIHGQAKVALCDHHVQIPVLDVYYAPKMYLTSCHYKFGDSAGLHNISMKLPDVRVQVDSDSSTKESSALVGTFLCALLHSTSQCLATSRVRCLRHIAVAPHPYLYFATVRLYNSTPSLNVIHHLLRDQWWLKIGVSDVMFNWQWFPSFPQYHWKAQILLVSDVVMDWNTPGCVI